MEGAWCLICCSSFFPPVCFTHVNRTRVAVETVDEWFYLFSCILRASRHFITVGWAAHKRAREQWERQQLQNLNSLVCKQIVLVINIHKQISVGVHFIYVFYVVRCLYSAASSLFYMRLAQSLESEPCLSQRYQIKHRITAIVNKPWRAYTCAYHFGPCGDLQAECCSWREDGTGIEGSVFACASDIRHQTTSFDWDTHLV